MPLQRSRVDRNIIASALLIALTCVGFWWAFSQDTRGSDSAYPSLAFFVSLVMGVAAVLLISPQAKEALAYAKKLFPMFLREERAGVPVAQKLLQPEGPGAEMPEKESEDETEGLYFDYHRDDFHRALFDSYPATYRLTKSFHFIEWNVVFELIFGHLEAVGPGKHVSLWARSLERFDDMLKHAQEAFSDPEKPNVDVEPLTYDSPRFSRMQFIKIAAPALNIKTGELLGWNCVLNIDEVTQPDEYYDALLESLREQLNWTSYAAAYDAVVPHSGEYVRLAERHSRAVGDGERILDVGAGTGYLTRKLLEAGKEVHAVDYNETMLERLRHHCCDYAKRLRVYKMDIRHLRSLEEMHYDGVVMMNVLQSLKPEEVKGCLEMAHQLLADDGVLALSVPREGTDLRALFESIRKDLKDNEYWGSEDATKPNLRTKYEELYRHNQRMQEGNHLHEFSKPGMQELLEGAGFRDVFVTDDDVYAGQGLFASAKR
ncbi:MAG: methyltransferase domain-containing protein [Phycisphaerae bacterium]|nr:methyltransferase domain-containing protein [Phycisphaerae bacterium]